MIRWLAVLVLAGCSAPDMGASFLRSEMTIIDREDPETIDSRFADAIDGAERSVQVAVPAGERLEVAEAVLDAWERGLEVKVVTDFDQSADPGIALLLESDVPVTLADDGLSYFDFNVNSDITFPSEVTQMTHAMVIVDETVVHAATSVGFDVAQDVVLFTLRGEDLVIDVGLEHNQVFGGSDAVATTAFDGMAKSITDYRWRYPTQTDLDLEVWFGPQERLIKRIIDSVYGARGSVHVLTNDFTAPGLARALQDKAELGFTVNVIVGQAYSAVDNVLSQPLAAEAPDVGRFRFTGADDVPTVVLVDYRDGLDGNRYVTRAFVLTHDLFSTNRSDGASPFGEGLLGQVNDQLLDGALWTLVDYDEPSPEIEALFELWQAHAAESGVL